MSDHVKDLDAYTESLEKLCRDLLGVVNFYADRQNWRKQTQNTFGLIHLDDQWDGFNKIGGKRAREVLEKNLEIINSLSLKLSRSSCLSKASDQNRGYR